MRSPVVKRTSAFGTQGALVSFHELFHPLLIAAPISEGMTDVKRYESGTVFSLDNKEPVRRFMERESSFPIRELCKFGAFHYLDWNNVFPKNESKTVFVF